MPSIRTEERIRLANCLISVQLAVDEIETRLSDHAREIQTGKEYLWEARRDMDHIEKIAVRQSIEQTLDSAEALRVQQQKLM